MAWELTAGLSNLRAQANRVFPDRDKASDGTIGDAAHQAGTSGHNPDDSPSNAGKAEWDDDSDSTPEVRAWDMDADLRTPGVTTQEVVDHIRRLPGVSSVLRYIIFNRKIYSASNGWAAEAYTGPSPHTEHVHFSGARSQAADNNASFNYRLEDLVALTAEDKAWIKANVGPAKVWDELLDLPDGRKVAAGTVLAWRDQVEVETRKQITAAIAAAAAADDNSINLTDQQVSELAGLVSAQLAKAVNDDAAARLAS